MVTLRARGTGDAEQQRPDESTDTPGRDPPDTRGRSTIARPLEARRPAGVNDEEEEEEEERPAGVTIRRSVRIQNAAGVSGCVLRRSKRTTKTTSRFNTSSSTRTLLKRRSTIQTKIISSKAARIRRAEFSDSEDVGAAIRHGRQEVDEDSSSSTESRPSRSEPVCPGPGTTEVQRAAGSEVRTSSARPDMTSRAFRSCRVTNQSEDDSDEDDGDTQKASESCWPHGRRTESLLATRREKTNAGRLADIDPLEIDQTVGFDSIGGLSGHISALKEMVVFPLLYPEVFENFHIQPPRGCLFYGPPGTGKTLVARALANECSHGNRKVAFFMRKGADCLSKWVGESERQLRLLFEQAYQKRPSIIFFDEIDGLAPVRSSRQDQIHSSIVSTLLALMDGLDSRGEVVVIGATNRLDAIDPALRRPGRFDREFLFGLPDRQSRREILRIHTQRWKPPPSDHFLDELSDRCVGYCGADIRGVCTEAALCALRRRYPQIYGSAHKLQLDVSSIAVGGRDFAAAMRKTAPASRRSGSSPAKPLTPEVGPLLGPALRRVLDAVRRLFPHAETQTSDDMMEVEDATSSAPNGGNFLHLTRSAVRTPLSHRPRILLVGGPGGAQTSHLAPAVLHALERFPVHSLDSAALFAVSSTSAEEACNQVFVEARRTAPSLLYLPHVQQWWETAGSTLRSSFLSLLEAVPPLAPVLLLATCSIPYQQLDPEVQTLFRDEYGEVHTVGVPDLQERTLFFQDLILNQAAEAPPTRRPQRSQEVLPLAPPPPPRQPSEQEQRRREEQDEDVLRELRLFLRYVTERLILDRRFKAFTKPVDMEEVPDYLLVVQRPMDLSTLLSNIDRHRYVTVGDFLSDADLIWKNALEYNPDSDPMDRHIRHRAWALKDAVRAIIRGELDDDFERVCQEIKESRLRGAASCDVEVDHEADGSSSGFSSAGSSPRKKKRYKPARKSKWSTGVITTAKRRKKPAILASSSSSSSSSSSLSSCDGERPAVNGFHSEPNGVQVNGFHHQNPDPLRTWTHKTPKDQVTGSGLTKPEQSTRCEENANMAALEQTQRLNMEEELEEEETPPPPLVIDHDGLRVLLGSVVSRTDGLDVEPLEKLYTRLAQRIYRHRQNHDKTQLLQEMKAEIDDFS